MSIVTTGNIKDLLEPRLYVPKQKVKLPVKPKQIKKAKNKK